MEYQQIGAWWHGPFVSTDSLFGVGPGTRVVCGYWVVFGTLLGPETTGPGFSRVLCFWFPGAADHACCVCGVWCTGLLFENYIVDASIFYKKQFPRL